jgi:hypothetical protein
MEKRILGMKFKSIIRSTSVLIVSSILLTPRAFSQAEQKEMGDIKKDVLKVYIEGERFGINFPEKEITFINCVKDRSEAQVYVLITSQKTTEEDNYTLSFSGQKDHEGNSHVLKYTSKKTDSEETVKAELVRILKMGLMRYVARTPVAGRIRIGLRDKVKPTDVVDKWNFWVFSLSADSFFQGEQTYSSQEIFGSFTANRVTPNWKIRTSLSMMYYKSTFSYEGSEIVSTSDSQRFQGLVVKSIDDHWSVGAYFSAYSSKYENIRTSFSPSPAIEYDIFPYSQSTKRQLRFLYRLGFSLVRYREETIYNRTHENLWREALEVTLELKQKWGTVNTSLEGSHYFHDSSKNRLELSGEISIRLFQGLSFNIHGSGSKIHDQLSLPKEGASLEEVLLQRRELATTYNYFFSVGLSYTFGSIRSNVVNPRFGTGGSSISMRMGM